MTQQDLSTAPTPEVNGPVRHQRWWPLEFYRSAVGKKYVMAITGVIGLLYVVGHMIGNLKSYLGAEEVDHYGEFLRELLVPLMPRTLTLWLLRVVLIVALVLHVHAAYALTKMNHRARPASYASKRDYVAANFASRTMRWTGIIVLLFIAWHLLDLTWGTTNPSFVRGDPYNNMVASFQRPVITIIYVLANLALGLHIFHGAWSLFQSIGLSNPRFNKWRLGLARGVAAAVVIGNLSFPIMVQAHVLDFDNHVRHEVCVTANDSGTPCQEVAQA
jgi:succinate dehydrogenase / fumarate reductase, cytochrome b subunit